MTKAATVDEEGLETRTCLNDGSHTETRPIPKLTPPEEPSNPNGSKGDASNPETVAGTERKITAISNDGEVAGSKFSILQLRSRKTSKNANILTWTSVPGAFGYIIYGNKCGSANRFKELALVRGTSWTHRNLSKGTYYKYIAVAYRIQGGVQKVIASSRTIHVATTGGKVGNYKAVKVNKKSVKLKRGKSFKIKAKQIPAKKKLKVKKHRKVCFESSNPAIATVSGSGRIKARKKGKCFIYAYSQSGTFTRIKVTVK